MSNKSLSLDALKSHLFETLEGVKNLSDPEASENEKVSLDQAKQIVDISGKIIDICKVQIDALKIISGMDDVANFRSIATAIGVADDATIRQLEP